VSAIDLGLFAYFDKISSNATGKIIGRNFVQELEKLSRRKLDEAYDWKPIPTSSPIERKPSLRIKTQKPTKTSERFHRDSRRRI